MWRNAFKRCELFQDVLCRHDKAERVVVIFDNQIQSEYYGGNWSVSIEVSALENFSAVPQTNINSTTPSRQCHAVFHFFYLMIANRILPLLLHTLSVCGSFSKTIFLKRIINYNTEIHWWLWKTIHMCLCTIPFVSYVSVLLYHNWSRYKCTCARQRSGRCT